MVLPEQSIVVETAGKSPNSANGADTNGTNLGTIRAEHEIAVLLTLSEVPSITYDELAKRLNVPRRTVAREIKILRDKGAIVRVGTNRSGYWKVISDAAAKHNFNENVFA